MPMGLVGPDVKPDKDKVETLRRLRSGGTQVVRVERVNVNEGGQAVIGAVAVDRTRGAG